MLIRVSMRTMLRCVFLFCTIAVAAAAHSQQTFQVNGRLKIEGGDLSGTRVVVYKNGEKERVINSGLNKFSLELEMNANYLMSFEKDGYVAKKLLFNTKIPAAASATSFTPFDYAVSLFKQYDDLNMVVFDQPVGVIRYEAGMGDFDYDTDYTKSIHQQLQQAIADVERKQKEESQNAAANARQKAAEEKAQAKAKAEAEKQALAQARAEAEAEKQAAADAKAKAEAEEKAAALAQAEAARKTEEERKAAEKAQADMVAKEEARKAEEARVAEAARKEAEKKKEEEKAKQAPVAQKPASPAPVVQPPPQKKPETPPRQPIASTPPRPKPYTPDRKPVQTVQATAQVYEGSRRQTTPVIGSEVRPEEHHPEVFTDRVEELIVEPNKVMTVIQLTTGDVTTEYRKVIHKWGSTFYFKDGVACTAVIYEKEALGDRLAGATPRGKLD
jgi:hypothetical protein